MLFHESWLPSNENIVKTPVDGDANNSRFRLSCAEEAIEESSPTFVAVADEKGGLELVFLPSTKINGFECWKMEFEDVASETYWRSAHVCCIIGSNPPFKVFAGSRFGRITKSKRLLVFKMESSWCGLVTSSVWKKKSCLRDCNYFDYVKQLKRCLVKHLFKKELFETCLKELFLSETVVFLIATLDNLLSISFFWNY